MPNGAGGPILILNGRGGRIVSLLLEQQHRGTEPRTGGLRLMIQP